MKRAFGTPVTFSDCTGFIHDGGGTTGILMLPAWGFEEFTIRRGWAGLANILADAGYRCLRFDWPGAGDSLGDTASTISLLQWNEAVIAAAHLLRNSFNIKKLVLVGHGVGGLIAPQFCQTLSASAMVLMAPQNEGRMGLRELDLSGKIIGSFLRLPDQSSDETIDVAGHSIARALAEEISALRINGWEHEAKLPVLTVLRSDTRGSTEWPKRLSAAGFSVSEASYAGYDNFLAHHQASVAPIQDFEHVRDWLVDMVPPGSRVLDAEPVIEVEALNGEGFTEQPILFGPNNRLFGVLCRPVERTCRATVILINSGDTYHIGWARMHVQFARVLAQEGIASFRIDTSGIGDSQAIDRPIFFDDAQIQDVLHAVTVVEEMGLGPAIVSGLCSGGYTSVQAAVRDPRIKGMVAINPVRLVIAPEETFEQVLNAGTASLAEYRRRAISVAMVKDVLTGRKSPLTIISKVVRILKARLASLNLRKQLMEMAQKQADTLRRRGVTSILMFSESDAGLDELARLYGKRAPADYDNAIVRIILDTEHNMTAYHAREAILQAIKDASPPVELRSISPRGVAA